PAPFVVRAGCASGGDSMEWASLLRAARPNSPAQAEIERLGALSTSELPSAERQLGLLSQSYSRTPGK
ncbi:hypothetical protein AB0C89_16895, partial [Streptomyces sp. NPDC048491]|uniref:hypothetical protein n=1 Tax=Streptomyces sp. NPDC048491 TaxID=3157207 RepID=UPI0034413D7B